MTKDSERHPHELISALLDGQVTVSERAAVELHLRDCAECRALMGDFRNLAATEASLQPPPVPAGLLAAVRARLEAAGEPAGRVVAAPARRWWTGPWRSPLPVAAAAGVMVAIAALWILRESAAPALHAPPSGPMATKEEAGAGAAVPGESEPVATVPERKQASTPPKSPPAPGPPALTPTAAEMVRQEPPPPPPGIGKTAGLLEADEAARSAEPPGLAASKADTAQDLERVPADARKQMAASPRPDAVLKVAAAGGRTGEGIELRFEFPEYSGSITEGGTIALRKAEYFCTARVGDSSEIGDRIASLFSLVSTAEPAGVAQESPSAAETGRGGGQSRIPYKVSVSAPGRRAAQREAPRDLPLASVPELVKRIRELVQGPLRIPLEEQCGPLPGAGGHEPAD